ncbi:serine/threonine-protein kinase pim-2-like [Carassius gibelio]|uniref:serine/threonine-protein kinase pim-2-like n=1 Tax=Carassius gibelio TaxID=101364 RepID=UPI002279D83F|nr:serine/threonine-protein kinase pim-2-like [Carassius gibelio]
MCSASESVSNETEAAAWLDNISFCSGFCQWIDEELIDSLPADSQQPVESTRASEAEAVSAQPSAEKSPTEIRTGGNRRSRIHAFFKRAWKAVKKPFLRCRRTRVESDPEPASVPGPSELQNEPDTEPTSAPDLPDWRPTTKSLHKLYTMQDLIGTGSFGKVYKAIRKSDGREVAIKTTRKWNNCCSLQIPGCSRRLATEVGLMLMLRRPPVCPYIIEMYEWFDRPLVFSLVLEFPQPCVTLREFIMDSSGLSEAVARGFMRQLVLAVQHCINHGVFHNDVHADNVLVNTNTLELKLIDFGSGHLLDSAGYDSVKYIGAFLFCPPEVFSKPKYYAVPTNVWTLGVTLYMMVNIKLPFSSVKQILKACPFPWKADLSSACSDLIHQCLERSPAKRPTLEQILQHQWFESQL